MIITVQTAQHITRLQQSYYEPLFNEFADRDTYGSLSITGTLYQSLLHLARCHNYAAAGNVA